MKIKTLIWIAAAILVCMALGWMNFQKSEERATISIETKEIQEDANQMINKGKELTEEQTERWWPNGQDRDRSDQIEGMDSRESK